MKAVERSLLAFLAGLVLLGAAPAWAAEGDAAGKDAYKQLPLRRDAEDNGMGWGVLAFLGVIGIGAVLVSARVRKTGRAWPKAAAPRIDIVERRNLNAACTVVLVRWDDEEVLLGCTAQSVSVISRRPVAPQQEQA